MPPGETSTCARRIRMAVARTVAGDWQIGNSEANALSKEGPISALSAPANGARSGRRALASVNKLAALVTPAQPASSNNRKARNVFIARLLLPFWHFQMTAEPKLCQFSSIGHLEK